MVRVQGGEPFSTAALAREAGVGVETVRFYVRQGLLAANGHGTRRWDADALRRLRFIRGAQAAGFTLREIGELIELDATEDRARALELARTRLRALDGEIASLERARNGLRRLARECGTGGNGPCPILASFGNGNGAGIRSRRRRR
ncbi:MAG: MerR family DNA-binding protein [Gluconacetobacter diazotrophicus]|nr:MerR family DNA-binding protein [Gluconacetobacter diazotrophicus]